MNTHCANWSRTIYRTVECHWIVWEKGTVWVGWKVIRCSIKFELNISSDEQIPVEKCNQNYKWKKSDFSSVLCVNLSVIKCWRVVSQLVFERERGIVSNTLTRSREQVFIITYCCVVWCCLMFIKLYYDLIWLQRGSSEWMLGYFYYILLPLSFIPHRERVKEV